MFFMTIMSVLAFYHSVYNCATASSGVNKMFVYVGVRSSVDYILFK